jgi:antirestriction protein
MSAGPRICVVSMTDLQRGILVGEWLDADGDLPRLQERVQAAMARSPCPHQARWGIWDYDGFASLLLAENESLEVICRLAAGLRAHGPAFAAWADACGREPARLAQFEAAYLGTYGRRADYAAERVPALQALDRAREAVPRPVSAYVRIDLDALVDDLERYGHITVIKRPDGGVCVFDGHI